MDASQAVIANIKQKHLDSWNSRFRRIAETYNENLKGYLTVPEDLEYEEPVYHRYMIRHPNRDRLQSFLDKNGIETKVNYPVPLHLQPAAAELGYKKSDFPVTEKLADTILSLPIYSEMEDEAVSFVIEKVREYCGVYGCSAST